jgi:molybdate transport system substrate-binding protein
MQHEKSGWAQKSLLPVFLVVILPVLSAGCSSGAGRVTVFAAAGAKPALDEACDRFEDQYGSDVEVSYGGGGEVLARMISLERGDVYIAPEQKFMESAVQHEAVDPTTIATVAYLIPVLAVQKGNPKGIVGVSDLARTDVRVALTRPETTLLGKYAREIFQKAELADEIEANVVTEAARPDIAVTMLAMGHVDATITWHFYRSLAPDELDVVWLDPDELTGIGEMQIAVSTYTRQRDAADRFVDFIASDGGKAVFERHGYIVRADEAKKYWPPVEQ